MHLGWKCKCNRLLLVVKLYRKFWLWYVLKVCWKVCMLKETNFLIRWFAEKIISQYSAEQATPVGTYAATLTSGLCSTSQLGSGMTTAQADFWRLLSQLSHALLSLQRRHCLSGGSMAHNQIDFCMLIERVLTDNVLACKYLTFGLQGINQDSSKRFILISAWTRQR